MSSWGSTPPLLTATQSLLALSFNFMCIDHSE
jgi:hypothetical protein